MPIRKFVETLAYGRVTNRVCYSEDPAALPEPANHAEWRQDNSFHEQDAVAGDSKLTSVIEHARKHGFAMVTRKP
jgi:hypothetical protein